MLSDNPDSKERKSGQRRAVGDSKRRWSDSQKIEAVTTYLALGELRLTANVLKIPEITLRVWKAKDWWKEIEAELRTQENLQLSVRLQRIVGKTLDTVEDRLQNGDFIYDQKSGELVRKPVAMKDAHKVSMDLMERREVLLTGPQQSLTVEALDERLEKLAAKFVEIAALKPPVQVTDVIEGQFTEIDDDEAQDSELGRRLGDDTMGIGSDLSTDDGGDFPDGNSYEEDPDEEGHFDTEGSRTQS